MTLNLASPDIALVRTFSSFEWDNVPRDDMLERISKVGAKVLEALAVTKAAPKLILPMTTDDRLGRTSYYLEAGLREQDADVLTVSSKMLEWEIDQSRAVSSRNQVTHSLSRICDIAHSLADWDDDARLVLVTSEPFIMAAHAIDPGTQDYDGYDTIEPGQVIGVHSASFKNAH